MTKLSTVSFSGCSGDRHSFTAYSLNSHFSKTGGVYIVTRRYQNETGRFTQSMVFVGVADDLSREMIDHPLSPCFKKYDANCICIYNETDAGRRDDVRSDLLCKYAPPCNA